MNRIRSVTRFLRPFCLFLLCSTWQLSVAPAGIFKKVIDDAGAHPRKSDLVTAVPGSHRSGGTDQLERGLVPIIKSNNISSKAASVFDSPCSPRRATVFPRSHLHQPTPPSASALYLLCFFFKTHPQIFFPPNTYTSHLCSNTQPHTEPTALRDSAGNQSN